MKRACDLRLYVIRIALIGLCLLFAKADLTRGAGVLSAESAQTADPSGYHLLKTIPIPGDTLWDYLNFQASTRRLFISHQTHVDVVNVDTGKIVGNIGGMQGIHGIALAPKFNRGFVTDGVAAKVWIFDLTTLRVIGSAPADKGADGEVFDPVSNRIFTMNGESQTATVIEARTGKVVGHIDLGGKPEFPVVDGRGYVYANIESSNEVIQIDAHAMKITHRWPLAPGEHPTGLAIDAKHHVLFSGCRNEVMVIMNADSGKVLATEPIGSHVDATRFDPGTQYAFASNGSSPDLTIVHEDSRDRFHVIDNVPTEMGARTMALDPKSHEVFLVTAQTERIQNPPPGTRPFRVIPGTFHLLIYGR
jgi:DNA-binding beta-propeller fold protein YncE